MRLGEDETGMGLGEDETGEDETGMGTGEDETG